jgi:hypothetical protein
MGYFIFDAGLFVFGLAVLVFGKMPLSMRRTVSGSAARVVGVILMVPLPLYLEACKRTHVNLFGTVIRRHEDPLVPVGEGYVRLFGLAAGFACILAATVLAIIASETPRRP